MTLAEKLIALRAQMVATKDAITALTTKDSPLDEAEMAQLEELNATAERQVKEYAAYDRAEKALAAGALPATGAPAAAPAPAAAGARGAPAVATRGHLSRRNADPIDLLVRNALVVYEAHVTHDTVERVIERRYGDADLQLIETSKLLAYGGLFSKNLQNPAFTNVQGWAQELVRDGYAAFKEALAAEAVVPRLPLDSYEFDNYGKITIPFRTQGAKPNLAGAFRAEGAPIRVGRTTLSSKYLTPKSMGVIGTFSKELLKRSTPNIEEAIKKWMLEDTAISLDGIFFDAVAGDVIRPAGLRNGIAAGDSGASSGNLPNNIDADIMARVSQLASYNMLKRPVWVMNPVNAIALSFAKTATGDPAYPSMNDGDGTLAKMPVYSATTIPADVVFLLDCAFIGFAGGAPTFEGSDQATVHEDDGDPNADGKTGASVKPIVDQAAAPAAPVRSFFQTNTAGVKATWELDWAVEQPGAVQVITGVAWGTPATP